MFQNDNNSLITDIKKKLDVMTRSKYRTTNFSVIEYFSQNNFQPLNIDLLIITLVLDYKSNPKKYVLSNESSHFKSEKTFESSIKNALNKNKSFVKGPGDGQISLDYQKTLEYLDTMYNKYKNNSKDIKTPIKLPKKKNEEKRKPKVRNIKKEKIEDEDDIDSLYSLRSNKRKRINNFDFQSPRKDYYQRNIKPNKFKDFRLEKEEGGIYNLRDSDSESVFDMLKKEVKREKDKESEFNYANIPDIFYQDFIKTNLTSSLDKDAIFDAIKYINDYLKLIEELHYFNNDNNIEEKNKKLQEIKNYLRELCENKIYYDTTYDEIKNWQREIYNVYKIMQSEFNAIKIEINNKTYSFDVYAKLRDIISLQENKYNTIVDMIASKLNEIKDIENNSVEKQLFIKRLLDNINIKKKVINSIEKAIKINEVFSFNQIVFREMPNYNRGEGRNFSINIEEIIGNLHQEKAKIIDAMIDIDNDIGNISI